MKNKYKISVHRTNQKTLTYTVDSYTEEAGSNFIEFVDKKTNIKKRFDSRLLEIEVRKGE